MINNSQNRIPSESYDGKMYQFPSLQSNRHSVLGVHAHRFKPVPPQIPSSPLTGSANHLKLSRLVGISPRLHEARPPVRPLVQKHEQSVHADLPRRSAELAASDAMSGEPNVKDAFHTASIAETWLASRAETLSLEIALARRHRFETKL
jgi:hypothetical protein